MKITSSREAPATGHPAGARAGGSLLHERAAAFAASLLIVLLTAPTGGQADGSAVARGKAAYARCLACHAVDYDRVGPRHCGIRGRKAGGVTGYAYSDAMAESGLTWTRETLDRFLAAPLKTVPGTLMTYDGVKDPKTRADLVAYLLSLPPC